MFNALNRFISRLDAGENPQQTTIRDAYGFQVLRNTNTDLAIEPWFDFIIGINGRNIDNPDPNLFQTEIRNCAGRSVELGLWSSKGQRIRSFYVPVPADQGATLGLSLQWQPLQSAEDVWHILEVTPNSPADQAGLLPYSDYIIGSPEGLVRGESGLGELVEDYLERPLRLFVYNQEYDVARSVTITPSRNWGGSGAMGCVLGFGVLHRIPPPLDEPPQAPGETLFETAPLDGSDPSTYAPPVATQPGQVPPTAPSYIVPANIDMKPPQASGSPKPETQHGGKKNRAGNRVAGAVDMDAYFAEGEAKSKELEGGSSPKPNSSLAPPPKAGAGPPPRAPSPLKQETPHEEEGSKEEATQA